MLGGNFGVWGGLFSTFDCAVKGYRQKEDPWNAIISGFLTGGTLAVRGELCDLVRRVQLTCSGTAVSVRIGCGMWYPPGCLRGWVAPR